MSSSLSTIRRELRSLGDPAIAAHAQRFFKTGKGEYGEGDRFLGIRVPVIRKLIRKHRSATLETFTKILKSKWHEERLFAALAMADRFARADEAEQKSIFDIYTANLEFVNNWDIVDGSAHLIIGPWLESRSRKLLYKLALSEVLWERRVAIMSTYHYIKQKEFEDTFALAEILLDDDEDLIHKAVGWMLREVGNRDLKAEEKFLRKHYKKMPRTMLRYAIERFPEKKRKNYLHGRI